MPESCNPIKKATAAVKNTAAVAFLSVKLLLHLYAADVGTVAGVDFDEVTFVDKEGNAHFSTSLDSGGLERVGCGITLDAGLGVGNLEDSADGHFGEKHGLGRRVADNLDSVTFFHESGSGNEFLVDGNLLESLVVHEDVVGTVGIEILEGTAFNAHVFEFFTDVETTFKHTAVNNVLELGAHESISLSGLYMEEFHAEIETAVHADAGAVLDVLSVYHKFVM